jgi:Tyrosine phosphatase family
MSEEVVKTSLELLLRAETHPILICDTSGVQRVGVVIGCLRRLQDWNLNSIINEYRGFALTKTRYLHELMIELFDTDLIVVPETPPSWFSDQLAMQHDEGDEFDDFVRQGRLSPLGVLHPRPPGTDNDSLADDDDGNTSAASIDAYRVYYYSQDGPLNSLQGADPPVINLLNQAV